ncbi:hypothetical protein C5B91_04610 [Haloferax sp. Atlit-10N]|uniref:Uncharacterized protein n=1 Tax=Haloferax prahovense (strain DSM 18310 / JCM 13924 / TL6) TaxID=1227461 RepID=M0GHG0_HALPT|nr:MULTISPECIES: hypothetical protein [Haloferax]ELZ71655.1 hypothetical protein C457_06391 [Haloferax prahovense DSM 18310]RDZ45771.1 hypothetical protein C5B86_08500 [Haloferax sp. Atlit-19N]RDZ46956.1 hypothetical protein C5B87_04610 [Haloferax sp. Atlit-16N]RDZ60788.1 hypothetical protein C5B91_04610 [Haloferax sp. Atlit-10N]
MRTWASSLFGLGVGSAVSYSFGFRHGAVWVGVALLLTYTIAGFGYAAFPAYRWRWSGPNDHFWYTIVGVLSALLPILAAYGLHLEPGGRVRGMVLLGGLWLGGLFAGIALERASRRASDD